MKKTMMVFALVAFVMAVSFGAMAADKDCAKACPKCTKAGNVDVKGKVESKTEKIDGKDQRVAYIKVTEAKGDDGKALCCMPGKELKITGAKAGELEKMAGKEVEVKGACKECKELTVASVVK